MSAMQTEPRGGADEPYWTPAELAARLKLKTARPINDAINRGELEAFVFGNRRRIPESAFVRWRESRRAEVVPVQVPTLPEPRLRRRRSTTRPAPPRTAGGRPRGLASLRDK